MIGRTMRARLAAIWLAALWPAALAAPSVAQTLDIATDQSPVGLDPHVATAFSTALIAGNIYEGLTAIDRDLRVVPALARSWTVSEDGLTYVFKLRPDASFHNGRKMTAQDVVASIARVRDPKTASPFASRFAAVAAVTADDDGTVAIRLETRSAPLLNQLAALAIVAPEAAGELARKPVGTGPFRLREWVPDTYILLEKNPAYWDSGLPHLDALKFHIVPEAATRQIGINGGTYQLLPGLDAATATALANRPNVTLMQAQDLAYSLVGLNTTHAPFDKPAVREAFNMAIDRAQLAQAAYFGRAVPGGPLSPALTDWALPVSEFPCYRPDPAGAAKKLAEAGISGRLKVTLNVLGSLQQVVDVAQVVQAQLNKAGFDAQLNVQEQGKFIADWRAGNFDAFVSLNGGGADPDDYFGRTFQTGGATNVYKYSNPELDKLLVDGRAEPDRERRRADYQQAQRILACTGPVVHLAYGTLFTAVRREVKGFQPMATRSLWYLREATLAK
jgi:peptide/nickel transport system substrate-binding protein